MFEQNRIHGCHKQYDKVLDITWYTPESAPQSNRNHHRTCIYLYFGIRGPKSTPGLNPLRLVVARASVFGGTEFSTILIRTPIGLYRLPESQILGGKDSYVDLPAVGETMESILAILSRPDEETIIRFEHYATRHHDETVTKWDKKLMRQILDLWASVSGIELPI